MRKYLLLIGALVFVGIGLASAQTPVAPCTTIINASGQPACVPVTAAAPLPVTNGGGGGGAATIADGADVAEGATTDAATSAGGTGTVSAKLRETTSLLNSVLTAVTGATPAGAALIGKVGIDQTTPGTTNGVQVNAALPAGTALLGKIGIDQTTPGTTNAVAEIDGANATQGAIADAASSAGGTGTISAKLRETTSLLNSILTSVSAATSQYPTGAVPLTASATGTTGVTTATLAASASIKTYICGFAIRANATVAATGTATVTGTVTATMSFVQWTAALASGIGLVEERFSPCVPSSAINTGIAVVSAAPGSGGTVSVAAWGYQL